GKSTLLRVMAGVYEPTSGRMESQGRKQALFDLSLSMRAEMTGVENIIALGLLEGRRGRQILAPLGAILTGPGPEGDGNLPLRTCSVGMALRLAFAVATSWTPDILLIDEVMGAGDAEFFAKAQMRLKEMFEGSGIVVFASHSMPAMRQFCNKGMV